MKTPGFPSVLAALSLPTTLSVVAASSIQKRYIKWVDCASNVPVMINSSQLPKQLPSSLHCGSLEVPMDYTRPISPSNTITLGFSMVRPRNPKGLVNFNPGGPNAPVATFGWQYALNITDAPFFKGLEEFDFLAMDVRGTFSSTPLNCSAGSWTLPSELPANETEFQVQQAVISAYAKSCYELTRPKGLVAHVGASDTANDWNSLRAALGYEKMHLLAWSYATREAPVFAQAFPENVGQFVFDANIPPGISNLGFVASQIKATNRVLVRADAWCLNDTACPFHSQGKGAIPKAYSKAIQLLSTVTTNSSGVSLADFRLMSSLTFLTGTPRFQALNQALYDATVNGSWSAFNYTPFAPEFAPGFLSIVPTFCTDLYIEDNTYTGWNKIRQTAFSKKNDPAQIGWVLDINVLYFCGGWPYAAKSAKPIHINAPAVYVTSDFDVNTPTEWTDFAWKQSPKSALIVRHGDGHGTIPVQGPARSIEFEYLVTGILPKPYNATYATVYPPGSKRGPIPDPYSVPVGDLAGDKPFN